MVGEEVVVVVEEKKRVYSHVEKMVSSPLIRIHL